jgi:hypothetical protein
MEQVSRAIVPPKSRDRAKILLLRDRKLPDALKPLNPYSQVALCLRTGVGESIDALE